MMICALNLAFDHQPAQLFKDAAMSAKYGQIITVQRFTKDHEDALNRCGGHFNVIPSTMNQEL